MLSAAFCLFAAGCSGTDNVPYVEAGNMFFDDAVDRLTTSERERFEDHGWDNIRGFLFRGERNTCVVIFSLRGDIISHSPDPAFCYENGTNRYLERL